MTQLNENVKELWEKRYAAYDGETYDKACERLVKNTFDKVDNETLLKYGKIFGYQTVEELRKDLLQALQEQYIIPNTPAWTNAGFENRALCACCTLGMPQDNLDSIMNTVTEAAKVTKAGYGLGINWSNIRPAQSNVNGKKRVASGPVSFMKLVDSTLDTLVQNGGKDGTSNRSGAAMGILDCTHPDYEAFITCKSEAGLKRTNISGMMYHDWLMKAFNDPESEERRLLEIQLRNMYDHAEASMAFYDNINKNWCDKENPIRQSNPCAEEFMPEYGTCNLVNINLPKTFVYHKDTKTFSETAGVIFLAYLWAELVNRTTYVPLEQMKKTIEDYQFIGISVMGLADMMIDDGIVYGSPESVKYCDELFGVLKDNVYAYSIKAADIFGTYNRYNSVKETENVIGTKFYYKNLKLRNALTMTCAPTGTTSMLANVSSGIEPLFSVAYEKECNGGTVLIVNELFRKKMHDAGYNDDEIDRICLTDVTEGGIKNAESIQKCTLIPESVRKLFVFNIDVDPYAQIDVMSAIQKHVDASISKTIILPNDYPFEKMLPLTEYAYEKGIKGFTVYRNHTRDAPIKLKSAEDKQLKIITPNQPMSDTDELGNERSMSSNICPSLTARLHTGCGKITITVATDPALDQNLLKVYISNTHSCVSNQTALGKTVYISARYMTPEQRLGYYKEITDAYHKIRCDSCKKSSRTECKSCADAIAKTIDAFLEMIQVNAINIDYDKFKTIAEKHGHKLFRADSVRSVVQQPVPKVQHDVRMTNTDTLETFTCPDCGHESVKQGKCKQCVMCGWQSCVE